LDADASAINDDDDSNTTTTTTTTKVFTTNTNHLPFLFPLQFQALSATVINSPHSKPFNVGTHSGRLLQTQSLEEAVSLLVRQKQQNNIVVIHYYVHNSVYPLYLYRMRVQYAHEMIQKVRLLSPS
jgi:hypothetical protein